MTWAAAHLTAERLREVMAAAEEAGTARDDLSKV
jgi:hypothetical protein